MRAAKLALACCLASTSAGCNKDVIPVPVRACSVKGTFGPDVLPDRLVGASQILTTGADISLLAYPGMPTIDDPVKPSGQQEGDVEQDLGIAMESNESASVVAACENAWRQQSGGTLPPGITLVFVRAFVGSNGGNQTDLIGDTWPKFTALYRDRFCPDNFQVLPSDVVGRHSLVVTYSSKYRRPQDAKSIERTIAHEVGHVLLLAHGDGIDEDGNGRSDEECDTAEFAAFDLGLPQYLMHPSTEWGTQMGPRQRSLARAAAMTIWTEANKP